MWGYNGCAPSPPPRPYLRGGFHDLLSGDEPLVGGETDEEPYLAFGGRNVSNWRHVFDNLCRTNQSVGVGWWT
jgi:hypothetical protein